MEAGKALPAKCVPGRRAQERRAKPMAFWEESPKGRANREEAMGALPSNLRGLLHRLGRLYQHHAVRRKGHAFVHWGVLSDLVLDGVGFVDEEAAYQQKGAAAAEAAIEAACEMLAKGKTASARRVLALARKVHKALPALREREKGEASGG